MLDAMKGGLFVGAAVVTGILTGLFVPPMVDAEPGAAEKPRAHTSHLPTMPSVIGQPLDEAQDKLRHGGIPYKTDAPDIVERVVPGIMEVCATEPGRGRSIRSSARLHVAVAGTCDV